MGELGVERGWGRRRESWTTCLSVRTYSVREWAGQSFFIDDSSSSDIFLQTTNKLGGYHLKKIKSRAAVTLLRLVESEEDRVELVTRLEVMSEEERLATAVIITREVQLTLTLQE